MGLEIYFHGWERKEACKRRTFDRKGDGKEGGVEETEKTINERGTYTRGLRLMPSIEDDESSYMNTPSSSSLARASVWSIACEPQQWIFVQSLTKANKGCSVCVFVLLSLHKAPVPKTLMQHRTSDFSASV